MTPSHTRVPTEIAGRVAVGAIFVSALLLFCLQPMIAKMALPLLGGTPAVWAVSMCVFQALLLAGYCYAHVIATRLPLRTAAIVHMLVLLLGASALPIALRVGAEPTDGGYLTWLIATLVASIGLPFLALSANAPLLQRWYGGLGLADSADPYRLYIASNAGSLIALLAYPVLLEPLLPLARLKTLWAVGYAALLVLIACVGFATVMHGGGSVPSASPTASDSGGRVSWRERAAWIVLALVPSGLLVAFTTFLTTDLASAPLVWVLPLALYLASFLVVFRERAPVSTRVLVPVQIVAVVATLVALEWNGAWTWALSALCGLIAFVTATLACHRVLYERRPPPARLTEFYLCMSLGGALGGVAAAIVAPLVFVDVVEFPLLLAASLAAGAAGVAAHDADLTGRQRAIYLAAFAAIVLVAVMVPRLIGTSQPRLWTVAALGALAVVALLLPRIATTFGIATSLAAAFLPADQRPLHVVRSFFGTHRVVAAAEGRVHSLLHGTTLHGAELRTDDAGRPIARPPPLTYYHASGPLARSLGLARTLAAPLKVGIVGLGAGAMACHAQSRDTWRFFELDPDVVRIARTPALFRSMSACQPDAAVVVGDARRTLVAEPDGGFDYLLIDAFSSDAIPLHMLTREAIALFLAKLQPRGILTLHVSNQNLDLIPSIEATLQGMGVAAVYAEGTRGGGALASQAVIIARDETFIAPALAWTNARRLGPTTVAPWTDDHSDIVLPVWRKLRKRLE